ncbi:MAG: peptide ABC transporter substrate-binding protein [Thermomicrobiales bacterium]
MEQGAARAAGTPIPGPVVIAASEPQTNPTPTGEQELRLAGTILDPAPLDPAFARDVNSAFLTRQVFRGLTRFDDTLQPVPELAERIEISEDGLTYRFILRDSARFSDGSPVTPDDVVYSLTRALSPATAQAEGMALAGPSYLADIAGAPELIRGETETLSGVRALDDRTVEIRLSAPRATFLMKLASAPGAVVDKDDVARGGEWWRHPNASGPFMVDYWEPAEELRLKANPSFVRGEPALKSVVFRLGPSAANPFNLYQADEIDLAPVPINSVDRIIDENSPLRAELQVSPILATEYIAFRTDVPPMDDPEIRRAIELAYPRQKIAAILLSGRQQAAKGIIPPGTLSRDWPASAPDYDIEAARAAIAKSRYESADKVPPIRIYGSGPFGAEVLRDVLQEELGLKVEVLDVHWPEFNAGLASKSFPAFELQWVGDYPDPETFLWALFDSRSPDNYSGYSNPKFDALLDQAAATLDVEQRAKIYAAAETLLLQDNVFLPVAHDVRYTLEKPWVRNLKVTPLGLLYLDDAWLEH